MTAPGRARSLVDGLRHLAWLHRRRVIAYAVIWITVALAGYLIDLSRQTVDGLTDGDGRPFGDDFVNFWSAAYLAMQGQASTIYDLAGFHRFHTDLLGAEPKWYHYSYPPTLPLLLAPIGLLPYVPGLFVWLLGSAAGFAAGLAAVLPRRQAILAAAATPALFVSFCGGQNGPLTAALLGGGLSVLARWPALAGVLFGLLSFKPQLGLLLPLALLAGREWRAFGWAAATVVIVAAASVLAYGPEIWLAYAEQASLLRTVVLERDEGFWFRMPSTFATARMWGVETAMAYGLQAAVGLTAAACVVAAWWTDCRRTTKYSMLVIGSLMVTPYVADYDMTVLTFVLAWRLAELPERPFLPWEKLSLVLLLMTPLLAAPMGKYLHVQPALLALYFGFWMQCRIALAERHRSQHRLGLA